MSEKDLFFLGKASDELIKANDEYVMREQDMSLETKKEYEEWLANGGENNE